MRDVLISGIGIAGPALAHWLSRYGYAPTLVERAARPRTEGYVIDFWGVGYDIAEQMGLLPDILAAGYRVEEVRLVNAVGARVGGFRGQVLRELTKGR
jgi:2-polyprenyl-6-methoxyphenol hydroxylase-like FAD-dependent oxidoreductase